MWIFLLGSTFLLEVVPWQDAPRLVVYAASSAYSMQSIVATWMTNCRENFRKVQFQTTLGHFVPDIHGQSWTCFSPFKSPSCFALFTWGDEDAFHFSNIITAGSETNLGDSLAKFSEAVLSTALRIGTFKFHNLGCAPGCILLSSLANQLLIRPIRKRRGSGKSSGFKGTTTICWKNGLNSFHVPRLI